MFSATPTTAIDIPIRDRATAGRALADKLCAYADRDDVLVLALPRGGVPVGLEIATSLNAPLDLMLVRKLGTPGQPELALGAIASGGATVLNRDVVTAFGIDGEQIEAIKQLEQAELERRQRAYRGDKPVPVMNGKQVILVDDGIATGATMRVAIAALRKLSPATIVVAVPLAPATSLPALEQAADTVVCLATPEPFSAIGQWYLQFPQLDDEQVRTLLAQAWQATKTPTR